MTKQQARKDACYRAALILQNALEAGWEYESVYRDERDSSMFADAIEELIENLFRRGQDPEREKRWK